MYGEACISEGKVRKWVRTFKGEAPVETSVRDRKRPGRPLSATDPAYQEQVDSLIRENRRVKQKDIAIEIGIAKERVHHIITSILGYVKVSARWVPRQLTPELKDRRKMCAYNFWSDLKVRVKIS